MSDQQAPPTAMRADPPEPFDDRWADVEAAVLRYLHVRLKSLEEARDALHDVYLQIRECSDAATILDLLSYALTCATNVVKQRHRDNSRHSRLNKSFQQQQSAVLGDTDERTPERIYDELDCWEGASEAFSQLPEETQRICQARIDGETVKSIAARLGLEARTVYRRLSSARKWLRKKLGLAGDREP